MRIEIRICASISSGHFLSQSPVEIFRHLLTSRAVERDHRAEDVGLDRGQLVEVRSMPDPSPPREWPTIRMRFMSTLPCSGCVAVLFQVRNCLRCSKCTIARASLV